jgi:hypothetical protein
MNIIRSQDVSTEDVMAFLFVSFCRLMVTICKRASGELGWISRYSDGLRFPAGIRDSSPAHSIHTGLGAHPLSYQMRTGVPLPEDKTAGA